MGEGYIGRMVFDAEASGGEVRQVVSPTLPFPLSLPSPFPFPPKFSDKPVGGKVRSSEGGVPRLPPYKYHPVYWVTMLAAGILDYALYLVPL